MSTRTCCALLLALAGCRAQTEPTKTPDDAASPGASDDDAGIPDDEDLEEVEPY
ncbi:hypothetical protein [Paraliomyxa miuraensis]|uniref:hypothetical protein n=1 Tax=Paraliomyxa miuraensis TaxID=376150 RepID=UPI00224D00B4|nr:hypothetical protein [Paraliomyxa miuraensis]MCX4242941.1 hypothetical protein [Paraliomyxa miuraensis]